MNNDVILTDSDIVLLQGILQMRLNDLESLKHRWFRDWNMRATIEREQNAIDAIMDRLVHGAALTT